jgi:hypothetical protein
VVCDSTVFVEKLEERMAWDDIARDAYKRRGSGYPSDMTDAQWAYGARCLPPAKRRGRPRTGDLRKVLDAIF